MRDRPELGHQQRSGLQRWPRVREPLLGRLRRYAVLGASATAAAAPAAAAAPSTSRSTTRTAPKATTTTKKATTAAPKAAATPAAKPANTTPAVSGNTVTVKAGDTLSELAITLGVKGGWKALYAANTNLVKNPNLIYVGQVLRLPA